MNSFELSRKWFDFSFENPEKIKPIHAALFFFAIEHCNRLGGKEKFGFPSQMTMDAIGVKSYTTYGKALNNLSEWGFITFIEKSRNQYSANIISINGVLKNDKARNKALDKALIKHRMKHCQSTHQSIDSIDKPINQQTNKPNNNDVVDIDESILVNIQILKNKYLEDERLVSAFCKNQKINESKLKQRLEEFTENLETKGEFLKKWKDYTSHFLSWHRKTKDLNPKAEVSSAVLEKVKKYG